MNYSHGRNQDDGGDNYESMRVPDRKVIQGRVMAELKQFIYQNARGNVTAREIENTSESGEYLQGICLKAHSLRTFRLDRILEYVNSSNIEERLAFHLKHCPPPRPKRISTKRNNAKGQPEICFTGFKSEDKELLKELAEQSGMFIRISVTENLDFLCCGYNAGPKKIEKARHQGVVALSENQFKEMIKTGEIPEE